MWREISKEECERIFKSMHRGKASLFAPLGHAKTSEHLTQLLKRENLNSSLNSEEKEKIYNSILSSLFSDIFYSVLRSEIICADKFQRLTVPVEKIKMSEQVPVLKYIFASVKPYFEDKELIFFSVAEAKDILFILAKEAYQRNDLDKIHDKLLLVLLQHLTGNPNIVDKEEALKKLEDFDSKRISDKYRLNNNLDNLNTDRSKKNNKYFIYDEKTKDCQNLVAQETDSKININKAFSNYKLMQSNEINLSEKYFLDNFVFEDQLEDGMILIAEFSTLDECEKKGNLYILSSGKI